MRSMILLACVALAGCNVAPPPEPQPAVAEKPAGQREHRELSDAINQPIDRAKSANEPVEKADAERDKALEDAGG